MLLKFIIATGDVLKQAPFDAWKAGRMVEVPLVIGKLDEAGGCNVLSDLTSCKVISGQVQILLGR